MTKNPGGDLFLPSTVVWQLDFTMPTFDKNTKLNIYAQPLIVVKTQMLYTIFGLKNSGLLLEYRVLVALGRSGTLTGQILSNFGPNWKEW